MFTKTSPTGTKVTSVLGYESSYGRNEIALYMTQSTIKSSSGDTATTTLTWYVYYILRRYQTLQVNSNQTTQIKIDNTTYSYSWKTEGLVSVGNVSEVFYLIGSGSKTINRTVNNNEGAFSVYGQITNTPILGGSGTSGSWLTGRSSSKKSYTINSVSLASKVTAGVLSIANKVEENQKTRLLAKKTNVITATWSGEKDGVNNKIKEVKLQYRLPGSNTWNDAVSETVSTSSFLTYNLEPLESYMGSNYQFRMGFIGEKLTTPVYSNTVSILVNNKPKINNVSYEGNNILPSLLEKTYNFKIEASDDNGDALFYYMDGETIRSTEKEYTFTKEEEELTKTFKVNDGFEDSEEYIINFIRKKVPSFSPEVVFLTPIEAESKTLQVESFGLSDLKIEGTKGEIIDSVEIESVEWSFRTGNEEIYFLGENGNALSLFGLTPGEEISYSVTVTDTMKDYFTKAVTTSYKISSIPSLSSEEVVLLGNFISDKVSSEEYYWDEVKIEITDTNFSSYYFSIGYDDDNSIFKSIYDYSFDGDSYSFNLYEKTNSLENESIYARIYPKDGFYSLENLKELESEGANYHRESNIIERLLRLKEINSLKFSNITFNGGTIDSTTVYPYRDYSENTLQLSLHFSSNGTPDFSMSPQGYKYTVEALNEKGESLGFSVDLDAGLSHSGNEKISLSNERIIFELNNEVKNLFDIQNNETKNDTYKNVKYKITLKNYLNKELGYAFTEISGLGIDFKEPPYFNSEGTYIATVQKLNNDNITTFGNEIYLSNLDKLYIEFKGTELFLDYNDNIDRYEIEAYLKGNEEKEEDIFFSRLVKDDDDYTYVLENLNKDLTSILTFKVFAVDKDGLASQKQDFDLGKMIYICKSQLPSLTFLNHSISKDENDEEKYFFNVEINYNDDNNYKNHSKYTNSNNTNLPSLSYVFSSSTTGFIPGQESKKKNISLGSEDRTTPFSIEYIYGDVLYNILNHLKFTTASGVVYELNDLTWTWFGEAPTISPRKNRLGINVKAESMDSNILLQINMADETRQCIKFVGIADEESEETAHQLIMNLYNGQISGFIISGGTWDKLPVTPEPEVPEIEEV